MLIHLLVYVIIVIHAFLHNVRNDLFSQNSMKDFFASFDSANTNIFDDDIVVLFAILLNDDSKNDLFLNLVNTNFNDALNFW